MASRHGSVFQLDGRVIFDMTKDPICGMTVDTETALHAECGGETFYFCSEHCRRTFLSQAQLASDAREACAQPGHAPCPHETAAAKPSAPAKYFCPMCPGVESDQPGDCPKCGMALERHPAWLAHAAGKAIYTCPMHPEVEQDHPGDCPKCGMALEPKTATAEPEDDAELRDLTRRLWVGGALGLIVLLLAMAHLAPSVPHWLMGGVSRWVQFALSTPVVLWAGAPFLARGWRSLRTWNLNMFTLVAIGVGSAYLYSVVAMLAPGLFPQTLRTAGSVSTLRRRRSSSSWCCSGRCWNSGRASRTGGAIRALLSLAPATARIAGGWRGARCAARPRSAQGRRSGCGRATKSPSMACSLKASPTSMNRCSPASRCPWRRRPGDRVTGGTINGTGSFLMRAERVGSETVLARIVQMVAEAQRSRAPIQALADGWPASSCRRCSPSRVAHFRALALARAGAAPRPRPRQCRGRAHHRLSLRARARHADVDHGRRRPRRAAPACW